MSQNKSKYWTVTTTKIVRANNKADAVAAATRRTTQNPAKVLGSLTDAERISAADAHYMVGETV